MTQPFNPFRLAIPKKYREQVWKAGYHEHYEVEADCAYNTALEKKGMIIGYKLTDKGKQHAKFLDELWHGIPIEQITRWPRTKKFPSNQNGLMGDPTKDDKDGVFAFTNSHLFIQHPSFKDKWEARQRDKLFESGNELMEKHKKSYLKVIKPKGLFWCPPLAKHRYTYEVIFNDCMSAFDDITYSFIIGTFEPLGKLWFTTVEEPPNANKHFPPNIGIHLDEKMVGLSSGRHIIHNELTKRRLYQQMFKEVQNDSKG